MKSRAGALDLGVLRFARERPPHRELRALRRHRLVRFGLDEMPAGAPIPRNHTSPSVACRGTNHLRGATNKAGLNAAVGRLGGEVLSEHCSAGPDAAARRTMIVTSRPGVRMQRRGKGKPTMTGTQRIYRTFRPYALDLAEKRDVPLEDVLLALALAASECPSNLPQFEIAQYVRKRTLNEIGRAHPADGS